MNNLPMFFDTPYILSGYDEIDSILVGLSGGADSVCLLHILCDWARCAGCKIYAAHVNHNIRTEHYNNEALRDEIFCRELCESLGVELFVLNADVPSLAKERGQSIEGAARAVRYNFFSKIMNENNIKILALAHNSNDNIETQLFNLCRGASVGGIIGIKQVRNIDNVNGGKLIRPILSATKGEILDYCDKNSLMYMTDSTNFELDATRNKIRHEIIPRLEEIFPTPMYSAMRLSRCAEEYEDFVTCEAEKILDACKKEKESISVSLDVFNSLHIALKKKLLVLMTDVISDISLESKHISSITELAESKITHKQISLPQNLFCIIEDGMLLFQNGKRKKATAWIEKELCEGLNIIPDCQYAVGVFYKNKRYDVDDVYTLETFCYTKCDTIINMSARRKKEGDKILDGGNHKKLKKLMCDKKIPLSVRDELPIILCADEIIYIPFCAVADNAKPEGDGKLKICIYKKQNK